MNLPASLDTDPYFASEAQEVFCSGERIFAVEDTHSVKKGGEGVYLGHSRHGALVDWDTPSGDPYRESVSFAAIKNLYR